MWRLRVLVIAAALAICGGSRATPTEAAADTVPDNQRLNNPTGFVERQLVDADGRHRYVVFVPRNYSPDKKWPLVVFLHGAGERGTDGWLPTTAGIGPYLRAHEDTFPFLVVFPQCDDNQSRLLTGWSAELAPAKRMLQIVDTIETDYSVDPQHRILTGWSMGGYGVWSIAAATPDRWSAIVPVSSGGDPASVAPLKTMPVWAIHGNHDNVIRPSSAQMMIEALQTSKSHQWLTIVPDTGHDVWKIAYSSPSLYDWMKAPTSGSQPPQLAAFIEKSAGTAPEKAEPVLEISNAAQLRMGNRLLNGLSYAIPGRVPASALSGSLADIHDTTSAEGYWFNVTFARIGYSSELAQARVAAVGKNRLQLQLALKNVNLTIGNTYIRGSRRSATAGPVTIFIGHQRPAWLNIVAEPYVMDRKLRLRTVSSDFHIDRDNYSVSSPWGVSVRGLGMDPDNVSDSIVQGLYGQKSRIESEVSAAVPSIMSWVEETLDISDANQGISAIWPLPVYRPNVSVWPESVSTDDQGVSIGLGLQAAAPASQSLPFRRVVAEPSAVNAVAGNATLQMSINSSVMKPLSQLLVESGVTRINVLDIPGDAFVPLVTRDELIGAIPEMTEQSEDVEIQTELLLKQSFALNSSGTQPEASIDDARGVTKEEPPSSRVDSQHPPDNSPANDSGTLSLVAPQLAFVVSIRTAATGNVWTPIAEFQCRVSQAIRSTVSEIRDGSNLSLIPAADADLAVLSGQQFAAQPRSADDAEKQAFATLLSKSWAKWISGQSFSQTTIADLDFQRTCLRMLNMRFVAGSIVAEFEIPPIAIYNLAPEPLVFDLYSPKDGWSLGLTLQPQKSLRYDIDYSLTYRRNSPSGLIHYTLKPGSHSEFRVPQVGGPPALFTR